MKDKEAYASGGTSLCSMLTVAFVILKLCKVIDWSWWWVLVPIWGPIAIVAGIVAMLLTVVALYKSLKIIFG